MVGTTCSMHRCNKHFCKIVVRTCEEVNINISTWEDNIKRVLKEIGCGLDSAHPG